MNAVEVERQVLQHSGKTSDDVCLRMLGSKEEPCSEVECNREEDVENDVWGDKVG